MGLILGDAITEKILGRLRGYGLLEEDERVLLIWDETILGSAKTGLLVTDRRIAQFDKSDAKAMRWADARSISVTVEPPPPHLLNRVVVIGKDGGRLEKYVVGSEKDLLTLEALLRSTVPESVTVRGQAESAEATAEERRERRIQRGSSDLILTTTPGIEGRRIVQYRGIVLGEAVVGANIVADAIAGIQDVTGGRVHVYEEEFTDAREAAFSQIADAARALGANAIVGIAVDYETIGRMLIVCARGTAVLVEPFGK